MTFSIDNGVLKKCKVENGETEAIIPDSVTSIISGAFWDCKRLKSITIPDSVTEISGEALL